MAECKLHNPVFNHVAISVPDCDAAVKWYTEVLGFQQIVSAPTIMSRKERPDLPTFKIYGDALQEVKIAFLTMGNGVGLEIFEFIDPKYQDPENPMEFNYTRGGVFHIAITDPEPARFIEKAVAKGATRIGEVAQMEGDRWAGYFKDPWGNVIEVLSCSMEQLIANRW